MGVEHEYEIPLDSFDARKLRFHYMSTPEKFGLPEEWTEEEYELIKPYLIEGTNITNMRNVVKFDVMLSRAKRYFWKDIAVVIKNVPTSPYVMDSAPI